MSAKVNWRIGDVPTAEDFNNLVAKPDIAPTGGLMSFDGNGNAADSGIVAANVYDSPTKVMNAVLANDGTGSGIDADKLDGYHSTSFLRVENLGSAASHTFQVANGETAYAVALRSASMYGVFALAGNSVAVVIIPIQSSQVDATNSGRNVTISASVAITLQVFRTR